MMDPTTTPSSRPDRRLLRSIALASVVVLGTAGLAACSGDDAKKIEGTTTTSSVDTTTTTGGSGQGTDDGQSGDSNNGNNGNSGNGGGSGNSGGGSGAAAPTFGSVSTPDSIDCHNGNFQEFTASWTTTNADRVTISIDGPGVYNEYPANGETSLPFNCSSSHTFLFTAYNGDGVTATKTITLEPRNVQTPSSEEEETTTTTA